MKKHEKCPICQSDLIGVNTRIARCSKLIKYKPKETQYPNSNWWERFAVVFDEPSMEAIYTSDFALNIYKDKINIFAPNGKNYGTILLSVPKQELDYSSYDLDIIDQKIQTLINFS